MFHYNKEIPQPIPSNFKENISRITPHHTLVYLLFVYLQALQGEPLLHHFVHLQICIVFGSKTCIRIISIRVITIRILQDIFGHAYCIFKTFHVLHFIFYKNMAPDIYSGNLFEMLFDIFFGIPSSMYSDILCCVPNGICSDILCFILSDRYYSSVPSGIRMF